mgnify:CR=1 FL=1
MKVLFMLLGAIILSIIILFIYCALVLAHESDMWMEQELCSKRK